MMESITNLNLGEPPEQALARIISVGHLLSYLKRVKDGRKRRGIRCPLEIVLTLFILANLCGENKVYGIAGWVQLRSGYLIEALGLKLKRKRLPHHSTYRRILSMDFHSQANVASLAFGADDDRVVMYVGTTGGYVTSLAARRASDMAPVLLAGPLKGSGVYRRAALRSAGLAADNSGPIRVGSNIIFTANITQGSDVSYAWDFGDGTTGAGAVAPTMQIAAIKRIRAVKTFQTAFAKI